MSRKRNKQQPIIEGVEIADVAAEGNAVARVNDKVVFIPFGAPQDIVDVKILKNRKSYSEAKIERIITPSPIRVEPKCSHFTVCGGCRWQHLPYEYQLKYKRQQVVDTMERIAKVPFPQIDPILGSDDIWEYRNKMEYTFSNKKWLTWEQLGSGEDFPDRDACGFHIPGAFDKVLDIEKCYLQDDISNKIRLYVREYGKRNGLSFYNLRENVGLLRTMMVRISSIGEIMVVLSFGEDSHQILPLLESLSTNFPEITSLMYLINTKLNDTISDQEIIRYKGKDYIEEDMEGLRFRIGAKSFYQTNSRQAYKLYKVAREFAQLKGDELVYDLYTGSGTIANFVARKCKYVIGIEYVEEAISNARINSNVNGIKNTEFYSGDMKDILTDNFILEHGRPDVMIVDPPRAGMHTDVVNTILNAEPQKIVYVSCNPATQARDIQILYKKYDVVKIQPVDMFPHTQHVENVALLVKR